MMRQKPSNLKTIRVKTMLNFLSIVLALLVGVHLENAQAAQFFRIVGPTATTINAFNLDGTIVWSGATPGDTYLVQASASVGDDSNWADYVQLPVTNSFNTNLIVSFNTSAGMTLVPAGVFTIGNSIGDSDIADAVPANVYVSAFYMDTNLVSLSQWKGVYSYATSHGYTFTNAGFGKATNYPVETVDWYDCVKWSNARSQQTGLAPVYYTDGGFTQLYTNGEIDAVYANWSANGYRLPTESEWEKAARGGLIGQRFPWGNTISENQANYSAFPDPPNTNGFIYDLGPYTGFNTNFNGGAFNNTSPVGNFAPNGYGLNDMAGNVVEWCWDWYAAPPYPAGSPYLGGSDPRGPAEPLSNRILRGGPWNGYPSFARCAFRLSDTPNSAITPIGFRCVRLP